MPQFLNLLEIESVLNLVQYLLIYDLRDLARYFRFFCEELPSDNRYSRLICDTVKLRIRALLSACKSAIENAREYLEKHKPRYGELIQHLTNVEHLVNEFLKNPELSINEILRTFEQRERDISAKENRLQMFVDRMIEVLERNGYIIVDRSKPRTRYICVYCDREFLDPYRAVVHFLEVHVRESEQPDEANTEGQGQ